MASASLEGGDPLSDDTPFSLARDFLGAEAPLVPDV
jgi:hypothetical protein